MTLGQEAVTHLECTLKTSDEPGLAYRKLYKVSLWFTNVTVIICNRPHWGKQKWLLRQTSHQSTQSHNLGRISFLLMRETNFTSVKQGKIPNKVKVSEFWAGWCRKFTKTRTSWHLHLDSTYYVPDTILNCSICISLCNPHTKEMKKPYYYHLFPFHANTEA